jgi:hypothetical protein
MPQKQTRVPSNPATLLTIGIEISDERGAEILLLEALKEVLWRFKSCIADGNRKIRGDDEAIRAAHIAIDKAEEK